MYKKSGFRVEPYNHVLIGDALTHFDSNSIDNCNQNCYT